MALSAVFKRFVEPSLERIPVLEVTHRERHEGREFIVIQTIQRNVFTEFDRKLSRHLAATRGAGFPAFTVSVEVAERGGTAAPRPLARAHHASVPHALKGIAERAFGRDGRAELTIHHTDPAAGDRGAGVTRRLAADDIEALDAALGVCRFFGEAEFLSLSGDFDVVIAGPPGELRPMLMHLKNGSVSMPCQSGTQVTPFECPLHGFGAHVGESLLAQGYFAQSRHALVATKETAVIDFRSSAERQILNFDRALAGRPLEGHRLESAVALVERLKEGLGSSLNGLSEDARITALDWSVSIETGGETGGESGGESGTVSKRIVLAHSAAGA
ncbi:MAG TPA: hypothetical protein VMM59_03610 [Thermohalobaculum sp.]|nr:hypothetical protein [Thermohalobaculum sp.]